MKIETSFLDGKRQLASFDGHEIISDANIKNGGKGSEPEPFDYFAASVILCAGHYAREFCQARNIDFKDLKLSTSITKDESGKHHFNTDVSLPADFPKKYHNALMATMKNCTVKKAIQAGPVFDYQIADS